MSKYVMLDLFSGLGGASQAMIDHPDWTVIRVDNNSALLKHCPNTIMCDVTSEHQMNTLFPVFFRCDLIWASPPCTEFSDAYHSPKEKHRRAHGDLIEYEPDMTLLEQTIKIIDAVKPTHFVIENVRGALRYFNPLLGDFRKRIGPYYMWGDFPLFHANLPAGYSKEDDEDKYGRELRSNARAIVPWAISEALRQSVQYQTSLDNWRSTQP